MYEDRNGTDIYYFYDSNGTPTAIRYYEADGTSHRFFLATNQQGDVIGLYNASGNLVVKYEYDAWGNIISETNATGGTPTSLAQKWSDINPFRYRSYYYDSETGLYYLNSRYYDSETGRFLNADDASVINATPNSFVDKNLFAYCDNNPVMREDNGGAFWDIALDIISIVSSAIEVVCNPADVGAWVGLALDVVDVVIPTGGGLGEAYDAYRVYDKGKDALRYGDDIIKYSDDLIDGGAELGRKVDFYVTETGDAIPATKAGFNDNLSKMEYKNGKYWGKDSNNLDVRVRVEKHQATPGYTGPFNPFHEENHFHLERRVNGDSGKFYNVVTWLMEWLR